MGRESLRWVFDCIQFSWTSGIGSSLNEKVSMSIFRCAEFKIALKKEMSYRIHMATTHKWKTFVVSLSMSANCNNCLKSISNKFITWCEWIEIYALASLESEVYSRHKQFSSPLSSHKIGWSLKNAYFLWSVLIYLSLIRYISAMLFRRM